MPDRSTTSSPSVDKMGCPSSDPTFPGESSEVISREGSAPSAIAISCGVTKACGDGARRSRFAAGALDVAWGCACQGVPVEPAARL